METSALPKRAPCLASLPVLTYDSRHDSTDATWARTRQTGHSTMPGSRKSKKPFERRARRQIFAGNFEHLLAFLKFLSYKNYYRGD